MGFLLFVILGLWPLPTNPGAAFNGPGSLIVGYEGADASKDAVEFGFDFLSEDIPATDYASYPNSFGFGNEPRQINIQRLLHNMVSGESPADLTSRCRIRLQG